MEDNLNFSKIGDKKESFLIFSESKGQAIPGVGSAL
jgi:hypothetical protein